MIISSSNRMKWDTKTNPSIFQALSGKYVKNPNERKRFSFNWSLLPGGCHRSFTHTRGHTLFRESVFTTVQLFYRKIGSISITSKGVNQTAAPDFRHSSCATKTWTEETKSLPPEFVDSYTAKLWWEPLPVQLSPSCVNKVAYTFCFLISDKSRLVEPFFLSSCQNNQGDAERQRKKRLTCLTFFTSSVRKKCVVYVGFRSKVWTKIVFLL